MARKFAKKQKYLLFDCRKYLIYFAKSIIYSIHYFLYNTNITETTNFRVARKEVTSVSVSERCLTIQLMEKVNATPTYSKAFGIVVVKRSAKVDTKNI